jgi:hypothetical protein
MSQSVYLKQNVLAEPLFKQWHVALSDPARLRLDVRY